MTSAKEKRELEKKIRHGANYRMGAKKLLDLQNACAIEAPKKLSKGQRELIRLQDIAYQNGVRNGRQDIEHELMKAQDALKDAKLQARLRAMDTCSSMMEQMANLATAAFHILEEIK